MIVSFVYSSVTYNLNPVSLQLVPKIWSLVTHSRCPRTKSQLFRAIWDTFLRQSKNACCWVCLFSLFFRWGSRLNLFGTQPPCIEADVLLVCGSCCWKCAGRNLDLHWAFFSYMGLYNPNGFIWKYRTLSNFMAWIITYRHFLSFYRNSHLGYTVYGCIWYNRIRITNVEFNLFAMP